jgi:hypothetical protein
MQLLLRLCGLVAQALSDDVYALEKLSAQMEAIDRQIVQAGAADDAPVAEWSCDSLNCTALYAVEQQLRKDVRLRDKTRTLRLPKVRRFIYINGHWHGGTSVVFRKLVEYTPPSTLQCRCPGPEGEGRRWRASNRCHNSPVECAPIL